MTRDTNGEHNLSRVVQSPAKSCRQGLQIQRCYTKERVLTVQMAESSKMYTADKTKLNDSRKTPHKKSFERSRNAVENKQQKNRKVATSYDVYENTSLRRYPTMCMKTNELISKNPPHPTMLLKNKQLSIASCYVDVNKYT